MPLAKAKAMDVQILSAKLIAKKGIVCTTTTRMVCRSTPPQLERSE